MASCTICLSPNRQEIEAALVATRNQSKVSRDFAISRDAIKRHILKGHVTRAQVSREAAGLDPVDLFRQAYGFEPLPWQLDYLAETRNVLVKKGRQIGASSAAALLAIHSCLNTPQSLAAIVSPSLKQSSEITTRARNGLDNLGIKLIQDTASLLRLENGSRVMSLPGTPRSVRGWSAHLLVIDEASYVAEETFIAARAVVATGGRLIIQSTPAAPWGPFYDLVELNDPTWAHFSVRSDEVPTISAAFLAQEKRSMGIQAYKREYEAQFGEEPGANSLFSVERLESLVRPSDALDWVKSIQQAEGE
jgi:hypothetical protein